jgi:hypothetical protein
MYTELKGRDDAPTITARCQTDFWALPQPEALPVSSPKTAAITFRQEDGKPNYRGYVLGEKDFRYAIEPPKVQGGRYGDDWRLYVRDSDGNFSLDSYLGDFQSMIDAAKGARAIEAATQLFRAEVE